MLMSFALGLFCASIIFYILYGRDDYKKQNTSDIVVLDSEKVHEDIREKVIEGLSRRKLVYSSSERCWVKRNQID